MDKMPKLLCLVVGDTAPISIVVPNLEAVNVTELKNMIKGVMEDDITCDANLLKLYLASNNGQWLSDEITEETDVQVFIDPKSLMRPARKLSYYFKEKDLTLIDGKIHVLVVVPGGLKGIKLLQVNKEDWNRNFFSQFTNAKEVDSWLRFQLVTPLTDRDAMYIRASYKSIASQILSNVIPGQRKHAIVTGTPGIGKSVFIYYLLWELIKAKKRAIFLTAKPPIYFDGNTIQACLQLPHVLNWRFWSPDLYCLVDSADPTTIAGFDAGICSTVLVSTPRKDYIGEFKKLVPTPSLFYMPRWIEEELAAIAPIYGVDKEVWQKRFKYLGGVPRLVIQDTSDDPHSLLLSACRNCSIDDCIMVVGVHSEITSKSIQTLIHFDSREPYREYQVKYASDAAIKVITRTKCRNNRMAMQSLLASCEANPLAQTLCGYIFERHAIDVLEKGGTFVCRKLLSASQQKRRNNAKRRKSISDSDTEATIEIPRSLKLRQVADCVAAGQISNQLYVPRSANYTAIDAWMPNFGGFQMTVGRTHGIKPDAANDLALLGENGNKLYFVLPPLYFHSFTKKKPLTIDQFAIRIPYPEVI